MNNIFHIAIDGPVASGKGTIARGLSEKLGIPCLDTGAFYRGIAVYLRDRKIAPEDKKSVTDALQGLKMGIEIKNGITHVKINGEDVTNKLRDNDISQIASTIAIIPEVRKFAIAKQQEIAETKSFILEGRDIASVVLPHAKYKFYLTSKLKTRGLRRQADLATKGIEITIAEMKKQIKTRDRRDTKKGGLKLVKEAIVIDNTRLTVKETIDEFISHISGS